MIIFDYNQVAISNLMEQIGYSKTEVQEDLVRHMILNTIRTYVKKFNGIVTKGGYGILWGECYGILVKSSAKMA